MQGDIGHEYESPTEELVGWVGSGLGLSRPTKGMLLGESFIISKNWLALRGAVSPGSGSARLPGVKALGNTKNKKHD